MKHKLKRLFVDMDGTLVMWRPVTKYEMLFEKGFFIDVQAYQNVVDAINLIIDDDQIEVFIISAYLQDSEYALEEKNAWLDHHLSRIDKGHRLFCPTGTSKAEYVLLQTGHLGKSDLLFDDYSVNLHQWCGLAGNAMKLMNGVNGTNGTWSGMCVSYNTSPELIARLLSSAMGVAYPATGCSNTPKTEPAKAPLKAINIDWDVDDEDELADLPTEIIIPEGMTDEDEISDYISDVTGFCHKGFALTSKA